MPAFRRAARLDPRRVVLLLAVALAGVLCLASRASAADVNATTSTFASAWSSARAGDRILLATGDYGDFAGGTKPGVVTIAPQPGASPKMGINFNNAANIRVDGVTITWLSVIGTSHDLTFAHSTFTGAAVVRADALNNANILFDGNTHASINVCSSCYEGRLEVIGASSGPSGVTIENSTFGPGGDADGIQLAGTDSVKVLDNEFKQIRQISAVHTDSLQLMGTSGTVISGNWFHDFSTAIMAPDGGDDVTIDDNVFDGDGSYRPAVQLGSHHDSVFAHNSVRNVDVFMDRKNESTDNSLNGVLRDNVLVNSTLNAPSTKCTNCTISSNLFSSSATSSGTGAIIGTPVFAGGSNPGSWAGFALAAGSPGKGTASDGTDRGIVVSGTVTPPPADTTPPDTAIASGPTGTTNAATPTFTFTATEAGSTFECRIDLGAWAACTSPWTTVALGDGAHNIAVRATDPSGNTDASAASQSFTVDTTAPDTSIGSGPTTTTNDTTPTFALSATETGSTFQCRVDAGTWSTCTSPWTTAALADGNHTVSVRARDAAGNQDASPAARAFTVDTTAPATTISAAPLLITVGPSASLAFGSTDPGARFECRLDGGAWVTCTSPLTVGGIGLGEHTVAVRGIDAAGNVEAGGATASWTTVAAPADPPTPAPAPSATPATTTIAPPFDDDYRSGQPAAADLGAPKTVKIKKSSFTLACGSACDVTVTAKVGSRTVTIAKGTGAKVTLTAAGRRVLKAAGPKGLRTTVRTTAGRTARRSTSRLSLT